jgi:hypothetical protein
VRQRQSAAGASACLDAAQKLNVHGVLRTSHRARGRDVHSTQPAPRHHWSHHCARRVFGWRMDAAWSPRPRLAAGKE